MKKYWELAELENEVFLRRSFWIIWKREARSYDKLFCRILWTNIFDEFQFLGEIVLTYNLLTVASFRIRVPSILLYLAFAFLKSPNFPKEVEASSNKLIVFARNKARIFNYEAFLAIPFIPLNALKIFWKSKLGFWFPNFGSSMLATL